MLRSAVAKVGLIRVLSTEDSCMLNIHGTIIETLFLALYVVSRCIPDHPEGVDDQQTEASAEPLVVELAQEFEAEGCSAIIIRRVDPGLDTARTCVDVPVIGASELLHLLQGRLAKRSVY